MLPLTIDIRSQSNKVSAGELLRRTDAFLVSFRAGALATMGSDGRFAAHVGAVVAKAREGDRSLREEANRLWGEVHTGMLDWKHSSREIAALRALTHERLLAFWDEYVAPNGGRRRALVSLVAAGTSPAAQGPHSSDDDAESGSEPDAEGDDAEVADVDIDAGTGDASSPESATVVQGDERLAPKLPRAAPTPHNVTVEEQLPLVSIPLAAALALQHELTARRTPPTWGDVADAFGRVAKVTLPDTIADANKHASVAMTCQVVVNASHELRRLPLSANLGVIARSAVLLLLQK